ncbi:MAG: serine hydrolase [Anaerolineae bacterium]|nr:serine hydrolase [Anaerolineae bacterium]
MTSNQYPVSRILPSDIATFLDTYIPAQLVAHQIPGASVTVVKDGSLLYAKGYGIADTETRRPVVAETTLFHIGSITKLFTWTAVMQLVEQEKIDLHADINTYLPPEAQFPATFPEPITMEHLLTHTAGLADSVNHLYRISPYDGIPLDRYVVERKPERVYPPGELLAYSNYAAGLAGYIIEQVTGMSYEDYIEQAILEPLEMSHSTIRQPIPPQWEADLALGHVQLAGGPTPIREFFPSSPIVGMIATSTDMAHFMIAQLQEGRYQDTHILQPESMRAMLTQQYTQDPRITGVTYGYVFWERNGQHILWHEGSTALFQGLIMLIPDDNMGVFISYNRKGNNGARREFRQDFLDHVYPVDVDADISEAGLQDVPLPLPGYRERVKHFTGRYRESRWAYSTADKIFYLFARTHEIRTNPDGTLSLLGMTYIETEPSVFREVDGQGTLVFQEDAEGHITHAVYDFDPHEVLLKMAWYETPVVHMGIFAVCFLIFLSVVLKHSPATQTTTSLIISEGPHLFKWLGIFNIFYPFGMFLVWVTVQVRGLPSLAFFAPLFVASLIISLLGAIGVIIVAWAFDYWPRSNRIHYTLVTLTALGFLAWLDYWNWLGLWKL